MAGDIFNRSDTIRRSVPVIKRMHENVRSGLKEDFSQEFLRDVTFETLINYVNEEFKEITIKREQLLLKYEDYQSLTHRTKHSVLPSVRNALCYLFGVTSEDDLPVIRKALGILANTRGQILLMIEYSISIVNVTRRDNRQNKPAYF